MKDDLSRLEQELAQLRPRSPGADCERRLRRISTEGAASGTAAADSRRFMFGRFWGRRVAVLGAAALVLLAIRVSMLLRDNAGGEEEAVPVAAGTSTEQVEGNEAGVVATGTVLYAMANEGTALAENGLPATRVRLYLLERASWETPGARTSFEIVRPREEVVYIPLPVL
ncbi:MAG: hypothetical protein GXP31_18000 [Kiritimatiellaeota bacterium]|nr:hypothetical protein [Kiritimatiellota bacterium]